MLSRLSWMSYPGANAYARGQGRRVEPDQRRPPRARRQGTLVTGLVLSATDTDMMAGWDIPKNDPADVVRAALDGLEAGATEVIADQDTADAKAALAA